MIGNCIDIDLHNSSPRDFAQKQMTILRRITPSEQPPKSGKNGKSWPRN